MSGSPAAFRKHGTFVYDVGATIARYGTSALAIEAMTKAQMSHAWVRIHGRSPYPKAAKAAISAFISELGKAGVAVAGWGWCQGDDPLAEAKLAVKELASFGLSDYVADIEHGVSGANWSPQEIERFCKHVRSSIAGGFGITTFPLIDWHEPALMKAALPFVDMFNPQVYWHHFPSKKMTDQFKRPTGKAYGRDNPSEYVDLCLDRWDRLMGGDKKDIVVTGQAYWGEGKPPFPREEAEDKLDDFLGKWNDFSRTIGFNWWHLGGGDSMSHRMLDSITKAGLGGKPYG